MTLSLSKLSGSALEVAPKLVGYELVRVVDDEFLRARIVETEAYREDDPASHSFNGETGRSEIMFGPPGYWYMYKCYGIHWMINVVCGAENSGEAVLIRAAEPLDGLELMENNRNMSGTAITNGPGKLAEALRVDDRFNGVSVRERDRKQSNEDCFVLKEGEINQPILTSPRVGISVATDRHWRFFVENEYVSDVNQNNESRRRN